MNTWMIIKLLEDAALWLLVFALLTACASRLTNRHVAFTVLGIFSLLVMGVVVAMVVVFSMAIQRLDSPHLRNLLLSGIAMGVLVAVGYAAISRWGWRRPQSDAPPIAATWPRVKLAVAAALAFVLGTVTHWNVSLAASQRLSQEAFSSRVRALSVLPGRPIDAENAFVLFEPVFDRLAPEHKRMEFPEAWLDFEQPFDPNDPEITRTLARHRADIEATVRAAARPYCHFNIHHGDQISLYRELGWIVPMRTAVELLLIDTRTGLAAGDLSTAARNTTAVFRMARHMSQDKILIAQLVAALFDRKGFDCLEALLNHPDLTTEAMSALSIAPADNYRRSLKAAWLLEEAMAIDALNQTTLGGVGELTAIMGDGDGPYQGSIADAFWGRNLPYVFAGELAVLKSAYDQQQARFDLTWPEAARQKFDSEAIARQGIFAALFLPALEATAKQIMIDDARVRLARLAIAARQYELEHGAFPGDLAALAPKHIESLPMDPSTTKPFSTEKVDGDLRIHSPSIKEMGTNQSNTNTYKVEIRLTPIKSPK